MNRKTLIVVGLLVAVGSSIWFGAGRARIAYEEGVNDALMSAAMLNLEQSVHGTNRTWAAAAEIVCRRLKVRYTIPETHLGCATQKSPNAKGQP